MNLYQPTSFIFNPSKRKVFSNNFRELVSSVLPSGPDVRFIYEKSNGLEKQQLLNIEFDNNLYYQDGMYRTPTILESISANYLK